MLSPIPHDAVSLADYQRLSNQILDSSSLAYLNGGAADQHTLTANSKAWSSAQLWPRVLSDKHATDTKVTLFGNQYESPVLIAPTAYHKLFHPEGELATAAAAAALNIPFIVSTQASSGIEEIAACAPGAPQWFQLYIQHDREFTARLVERATSANYQAIVLTVDAPINGIRNAEQRAGFKLPQGVEAINLRGMRTPPAPCSALDPHFTAGLPSWKDIAWLKSLTHLPIILKGILHPLDAQLAIDHGADAIIVSNHGGRTLDQVPSTQNALPHIAKQVNGQLPILVDGGIRRGTDVLHALALGADAVLIGRPIIHGLSVAGATGVAHVLKLIQHELEVAMLLGACTRLADAKHLFPEEFSQPFN
ncbi:alpha-hydroxy acid oxidase [Rubritalea sp.]|uniref:alpha-hydroxy acid oxidase n=1 Tax=Rubritalea sp. TaxID=2109375 RepID=UPI003EF1A198